MIWGTLNNSEEIKLKAKTCRDMAEEPEAANALSLSGGTTVDTSVYSNSREASGRVL